jgi:hypothetical protein
MHAGIALLHRGVVEEDELVEPAERDIREPRADQPDDEIDDDGQRDGDAEMTSPVDTMAARITPTTMPRRSPKVTSDATMRRNTTNPPLRSRIYRRHATIADGRRFRLKDRRKIALKARLVVEKA